MTTFVVPGLGAFKFKRMVMGLRNSSSVYQAFQDRLLGASLYQFSAAYIDDCVVYSKTLERHLEDLQYVMQRNLACGCSLNLAKSEFCVNEPREFLGYDVCGKGVAPCKRLMQGITDMPIPKTLKDLRSALGLFNFHRQFIRAFAEKTHRLVDAIKRGTAFDGLTQEEIDDFNAVRRELEKFVEEKKMLYFVDWSLPIEIYTDASKHGIGAFCFQRRGKDLLPIAYLSRAVSAAEANYWDLTLGDVGADTRQLEMLALVWSLDMLSQTLGISSNVTLWTDHRNILHILKQGSNSTGMKGNDRLMRWALKLSQWPDLKIRYQPGLRNECADALSRLYSQAKIAALAALATQETFLNIEELPTLPVAPEILDASTKEPGRHFKIELGNLSSPSDAFHSVTRDFYQNQPNGLGPSNPVNVEYLAPLDPSDPGDREKLGCESNLPPGFMNPPSIEEIRDAQMRDPELSLIKTELENINIEQEKGNPLSAPPATPNSSKRSRKTVTRDNLVQNHTLDKDGIVRRVKGRFPLGLNSEEYLPATVPVIPVNPATSALRQRAIRYAHAGLFAAHMGKHATLHRVRQRYYWAGMEDEVKCFVRSCLPCRLAKTPTTGRNGFLQSYQQFGPFDTVAIDIVEFKSPLCRSRHGESMVLVVMDIFSRYLICVPLKSKDMKSVAAALIYRLFLPFGAPRRIVADSAFDTQQYRTLMSILKVEVDYVSPYNSRSNPAERYCGFVQRLLRTFVAEWPKRIKENQWFGNAFDYLDFVVQAHNSSPYQDSSISPFEIIFGRAYLWPTDISMIEHPDFLDETIDLGKYLEDRRKFFEEATTFIRAIINEVQAKNAVKHDALQKFLTLQPKDQVIIHTPTRQGKLASQWIGPAVVISKHSDLLYRVRFPDTNKTAIVHVRRLARYHPNPNAPTPTPTSTGRRLRSNNSSGVSPRVPRSAEGKQALCNRRVRKFFGKSAYLGRVAYARPPETADDEWLWKINYDDGDSEDCDEYELDRILCPDSTQTAAEPLPLNSQIFQNPTQEEIVILRGNDSGRHYVARVVDVYPDTREIKIHFFCHQMTRSRGNKSSPIYDDMLPLNKRILSPEYIYFVKSTSEERRVGTFNPKPNYQPMTDVVKLGKDKYDHALIMRNVQLTDSNRISEEQINELAELAPDAAL